MPDAIPACFRAAAAPRGRASSAAASASSGAGTSLATSVYDTRLGLATLSWSRAALGLCLRAVLRVSSSSAPSPSASSYGDGDGDGDGEVAEYEGDDDEEVVAVRVRPWLLWRRRGSKRFRVRGGRRVVDVAWDLTRARFPPSASGGGSPEPCAGYFVAVVVDGEMAVVAGDMAEEAYRRTRARRPPGPAPVLVSRREHVSMRDGRGHRTCVVVRGKEREISVDLVSRAAQSQGQREKEKDRAEVGMSVCVDGDRVLHVRRLRWKFRGTEKVDLGGGDRVLVSWDLHNWLFPGRDTSAPDASAVAAAAALAAAAAEAPPAHAVFVFRLELAGGDGGEERDPADDAKEKEPLDKAEGGGWAGYVGRWGRAGDWSESSSNGGEKRRRKRGQASRLAKASSSSSASVASSSASWASGSTVMDWGSPEEAELQSGDGFSLLVYAWKN